MLIGIVRSPVPYSGLHPYNWPVVVFITAGYLLTFLLFFVLIRQGANANFQPTLLGFAFLFTALLVVLCTLWLITLAHGFRRRLSIIQGVGMGLLADLLVWHGLGHLYRPTADHAVIEFVLFLGCSGSAILLAVHGNADGLERGQREQRVLETDELTGLLNRHGVARRYSELSRDTNVIVMMLDLNNLKAINDRLGHSAGDHLLKTIAHELRSQFPAEAILGRWGGDEFVTVLPGKTRIPELMMAVQANVRHMDATLAPFAMGSVQIRASVPLERALALADQRMYADKNAIYRQRERLNTDDVGITAFPHFLMGLSTQQQILERGAGRAAKLADFEGWFFACAGETVRLTYQERLGEPVQHTVIPAHLQDGGTIAAVFRRGRPIWAADYEQSPHAQDHWIQAGLKSLAVAPVTVDGTVVAAVGFTSHMTWRSMNPQAEQLLEAVAIRLAQQIEQDRVLERMQASVEAGIIGMGVIMEARDLETAGHTNRVVKLALQLGAAAGLDLEQLQALRLGAYLHDVGKLGIPDRVLLKPSALDAEEWALMQSHSEMGARMALRLPSLPSTSVEVIRSHHERWDGAGYPQGLAGESIPLLARIFALCDVYDALVNVRPYKAAWTLEAARAEVLAQAGKHFDPQLTALFMEKVLDQDVGGTPNQLN